jgi:hypothetical protein
MKKILFLLAITIFLSGCSLPPLNESLDQPPEPIFIKLESDLTNVKSNDITFLYLILDNLDKDEEYDVEAKIINPGVFSVLSSPSKTTISSLEKKTLEWELKASSVPKETNSQVSVEIKISKTFEFSLPITFANPLYLREKEQAGTPIPKKPKSYSFSDSLIYINVELNKEPPIDNNVIYANLKLNPKVGFIESFSLTARDAESCDLDNYNKAASCKFKVDNVEKIEERKFRIEVNYVVKIVKSLEFVILPLVKASLIFHQVFHQVLNLNIEMEVV